MGNSWTECLNWGDERGIVDDERWRWIRPVGNSSWTVVYGHGSRREKLIRTVDFYVHVWHSKPLNDHGLFHFPWLLRNILESITYLMANECMHIKTAYLALSVENFAHECLQELTNRLPSAFAPCFCRATRWWFIWRFLFPTQTFCRRNAVDTYCIWRLYEIRTWMVCLKPISVTTHYCSIRGARSFCIVLLPY